ncbi:hypothetical protein CV713_07505 [Streptococcus thermophilus]|nr:hypothetical protein [Streptococcus thermophilus]PJH81152.1 hypothetical protein CV714_04170 [Streptococcus thermophilus]PJH82355.1 hypothetical protein CV713_07505 [Streptococcus thermophilus]
MTTKIQKENRSLEETIKASKKLLSSKDKPLDENLTVKLKNEVSTVEKKKQVIPKIKKKTSDINKQVKSLKKPINYTTEIKVLKDKNQKYSTSVKQLKQITNPSNTFVESRLKEIDTISDVQSATEDNDPNQGLNKQGSYTAAVYFADNEVTNPVPGADLVAKGTDAGGCVEVYKTAEDAKKRNDYLSAFDGLPTVINPGSHYVYGTVVIRVSASLTASQQNALTQKIYEKLIEIKDDSTSKNTSKTETSSSTKPSSSSSSSTQATVSESAYSDTRTVAGSTPKTPAQQQDSGVPESSNDIMLNPEYHSYVDENGYNSLLGANVLDNSNGGNNSNASTESSSMGSSK